MLIQVELNTRIRIQAELYTPILIQVELKTHNYTNSSRSIHILIRLELYTHILYYTNSSRIKHTFSN